jgi:hypothetical protein
MGKMRRMCKWVRKTGRKSLRTPAAALLALGLSAFGCAKRAEPAADKAEQRPSTAPNPEFDQKWSSLAQKDVDVFYVEDDRGEGLMGNVRRARHNQTLPVAPPAPAPDPNQPPASLSQEDIQLVIRQNLPGVKACFLRISREGEQRSGKAIVSFEIAPGGEVRGTKVDAPSFAGTSLPGCVSGMVSHWAFPKSQNGGLAISYPFVFVGG